MNRLALTVAVLISAWASVSAYAQPPAPAAAQPKYAWQPGPVSIPLPHDIKVDVPANQVFLAAGDAKKLLEKTGNFMGDDFLGMVISKNDDDAYWIAIEFSEDGYVKDDEKIDADAILKGFQENQEQGNKERAEKGFPPLFIDGWSDAPRYDKGSHQLVWALDVHSDRGKSVNYNTRVLGRKGYVSLNLITSPDKLAGYKPAVQTLLAKTEFGNGARYNDFNSKTDKMATYGLVGLIAGGAGIAALKVAKLGFLAAFGKTILIGLAKFGKAIAVAFVAFFGYVRKLITGKSKPAQTKAAPPPAAAPSATPATAASDETGPPTSTPAAPPTDDFK